jgi:hypothetical protein
MDFQFTSRFDGVTAKCSMEHQAVANWFNTEVRLNSSLISTALSALQQAPKLPYDQEFCFIGAEYGLFINADEVMIKANNLNTETDQEALLMQTEQDFHYYDSESIAFCGLEDFERFLRSYLAFVGNSTTS